MVARKKNKKKQQVNLQQKAKKTRALHNNFNYKKADVHKECAWFGAV